MDFLEACWKDREENIYPQVFGDTGAGIYLLTPEVFQQLGTEQIDPRWLTYGVFKCAPTKDRSTWAYVSSGLSNPWETEAPEDYSGLGVEFVIETGEDETWAIELLHTLIAYNLSLASGQMGNLPTLNYGDRVPLNLSDAISSVMLVRPVNFPDNFDIKSGRVDLLQFTGITAAELEYSKANSSDVVAEKLRLATGGFLISKDRESVV